MEDWKTDMSAGEEILGKVNIRRDISRRQILVVMSLVLRKVNGCYDLVMGMESSSVHG